MRYITSIFCLLAAAFLLPATILAQPTLEDFGKLPDLEKAAISPDGQKYAVIGKLKGERKLIIIKDKKPLRIFGVGPEKVRGVSWVKNNLVMLTFSRTEALSASFNVRRAEMSRTVFISTDGAKDRVLFAKQRTIAPINAGYYGLREIDGTRYGFFGGIPLAKKIVRGVADYYFEGGNPGLYRVKLDDLSTTRLVKPLANIHDGEDWFVDAKGELAATLKVTEDGRWRLTGHKNKVKISGQQSEGRVSMVGFLENGRYLVFGKAPEGQRQKQYYKLNLESGAQEPYLHKEEPRSFYVSHLTSEIFGYVNADEDPVFFDPTIAKRRAKIRKAFPDLNRQIVDYNDDFTKVVLATDGNKDSGTYWQVDLAKLSAAPLGFQRKKILPKHVGKISTVEYKASDGMEMDGILTLPPGKEAENLPLVMMPHGGPREHDKEEFDWWAQAMAFQGYAVFQPNFRGSTGRGQSFLEAGYGEWGRKMQTDISDGLAHLAKAGIVDPKRACIVGASYGGYAALAGVTLQKDIYRCAVSVNGVSDLPLMVRTDRREGLNNRMLMNDLYRMVGKGKELKEISPRHFAQGADAPILMIHGKDDTVVPFRQSKVMAGALKKASKPHQLITLDDEDHWLSKEETRFKMLQQTVAFLQKHNPAE